VQSANGLARSRYRGIKLVSKVAWAGGRVDSIELGGEQPDLGPEGIPRLSAKRRQQVGLRCSEPVIETGEQFVSLSGGDDSTGAPIGRVRTALYQAGCFEVIQEVGHDGAVDPEMLGQRQLATHRALSGRRKNLVAARAPGKTGHGLMGSTDVAPEDHAQPPSEVVGQRVLTAGRVPTLTTLTGSVVHRPIIPG
jgi:hypothetical protein